MINYLFDDYPEYIGAVSMAKFEAGDEAKVIGIMSGHQIPVGTKITVSGYLGQFVRAEGYQWNLYEQDLEELPCTKERVEKRLAKKEKEFSLLKSQIEYLEETGVERLDKQAFKDHLILKILADQQMALQEKSRRIQSLFE